MTQRSGREPDRRPHARIAPKGAVTRHALGNVHRGRLVSIAAGGVCGDRDLRDKGDTMSMIETDLQRLEGVWTGTEHVRDGSHDYDASGRLVFQTVFDGRFLLCDYMQTARERPPMFAHGVFRRDDRTNTIAVTWFRSRATAPNQQADAVAEGDTLIFVETIDGRTTRTSYRIVMDRLSVYTECATGGGEWERIFEGSYRRR